MNSAKKQDNNRMGKTRDLFKKTGDKGNISCKDRQDIRECEVKWALGSITRNKASGGDGIHLQS